MPDAMASAIPSFKVVIAGEYGVGKSSIFHHFRNSAIHSGKDDVERGRGGGGGRRESTCLPLDNCSRIFHEDNRMVKIDLWDTAGIERFSTLSKSYYSKATAVIVCFSYDSKESFNAVAQQHIFDAIEHSRTTAVFVCGNMADKKMADEDGGGGSVGDRVQQEDCVNLLTQFDDIITRIFTVSCRTGDGVEEMFVEIARTLLHRADSRDATRLLLSNSDRDPLRDVGKKPGCC